MSLLEELKDRYEKLRGEYDNHHRICQNLMRQMNEMIPAIWALEADEKNIKPAAPASQVSGEGDKVSIEDIRNLGERDSYSQGAGESLDTTLPEAAERVEEIEIEGSGDAYWNGFDANTRGFDRDCSHVAGHLQQSWLDGYDGKGLSPDEVVRLRPSSPTEPAPQPPPQEQGEGPSIGLPADHPEAITATPRDIVDLNRKPTAFEVEAEAAITQSQEDVDADHGIEETYSDKELEGLIR